MQIGGLKARVEGAVERFVAEIHTVKVQNVTSTGMASVAFVRTLLTITRSPVHTSRPVYTKHSRHPTQTMIGKAMGMT